MIPAAPAKNSRNAAAKTTERSHRSLSAASPDDYAPSPEFADN
jgi:hypothetical protein